VSFEVTAGAYDAFMGRYSVPLAPVFAEFAGVVQGQRVLDVGCGTGALTDELVGRAGLTTVSAVDPSVTFVGALQERHPNLEVRQSAAERLPFDDRTFDATLAQLVVHFMDDPIVGLQEMGRVTADSGIVAACVWDHDGGGSPLSVFWEAARDCDGDVQDESRLAGARQGHLVQLMHEAGLRKTEEELLTISVQHPSFDDWWQPYLLGVGPAGKYVQGLAAPQQARLLARCQELLPAAPFTLTARAWAARGVPG
jgi:SAM-dependent methyltransferase